MFWSGTWRCSPGPTQGSVTQIHAGRLTRADHPQGPLALVFLIFAMLYAFKCTALSEPRGMQEEGFQESVPRPCRSLFSEWFSKGTKSRQDTEITPVLVPLRAPSARCRGHPALLLPSCTIPGPPHLHHLEANPLQVSVLPLWCFHLFPAH